MALTVTIPDELADELTRTAEAAGKTAQEIAVSAIRRNLLASAKLSEALAPIRDAFHESGLTEDEAVELFEAEKPRPPARPNARQVCSHPMTTPERVVFDCNIFFQALINPLGPAGQALEAVADGRCILFVSKFVFDELQDVTSRPPPGNPFQADARIASNGFWSR